MKTISWMIVALATSTLTAACGSRRAPAGPPPTLDEVMENYVEAIGGRAAVESVTAMRSRGRFEVPAAGMSGAFEMIVRESDGKRMRLHLPRAGEVQSGVTGGETDGVAWKLSDAEGARVLRGRDRKRELLELHLVDELDWHRSHESGKVVGAADYNGRPAWKIEWVSKVGDLETRYYDRETHLLLGSEDETETEQGTKRKKMRVLAYGDFPPVKMETAFEVAEGDTVMRLILESIELNPELPVDVFALPPEVAALR